MKKSTPLFIGLLSLGLIINAQTTSPAPYCNAGFDDDMFAVNDAIFGVTLGTLNNQSNAQYAAPHYVFYNNLAAPSLIKGNQYLLSAKFDVHGGVGIGVWIDYNQNNIFEPSEKILNNPAGGVPISLTTQTVNVTIPANALTGTTRMRVRIVEDDNFNMNNNYVIVPCNASNSPADVMDWGETEDYNVTITNATGINESTENNLSIISFPNPVENILSVSLKNTIDVKTISLKNIDGKVIDVIFINTNNLLTADVSNLSAGIYFLEIITNEGFNHTKIIKN